MGWRVRYADGPAESSTGYGSRTLSTSLTNLENFLHSNGEGNKKLVEKMLRPSRLARTGHLEKIIPSTIGDLNAKIGPRRTPGKLHIGYHGLQWNEHGERPSEFIMTTKTIHGNLQFQKSSLLRWESPDHNEIGHIIDSKRFCLTYVAVVPKFCMGSDHRLLRKRFSSTWRGEKAAKFTKRTPRTIVDWELFASLVAFWEGAVME
ncbi:hypothetical protein RB195_001739 [Necator americanus]|uniref:Uncharacterized protein n=1 Tax=Necator americanus TaxID=51031 RepID=A0ABR1DFP7_NECAM